MQWPHVNTMGAGCPHSTQWHYLCSDAPAEIQKLEFKPLAARVRTDSAPSTRAEHTQISTGKAATLPGSSK